MDGVSLRPGGAGLSAFALGSRPLKQSAAGSKEEKGYDEVIKYDRAVLLAFKEVRRPAAGCPRRLLLTTRCPAAVHVGAGGAGALGLRAAARQRRQRVRDAGGAVRGRVATRQPAGLTACFSGGRRAAWPSRAPPSRPRTTATGGRAPRPRRRVRCVRACRSRFAPTWRLSFRSPQQSGNGGGGGGGGGGSKRGSVRSSMSKGEGMVDRTPLPAGEAGAEIVRAANPWTRAGPADDLDRLRRNVKGCVAAADVPAPRAGPAPSGAQRER